MKNQHLRFHHLMIVVFLLTIISCAQEDDNYLDIEQLDVKPSAPGGGQGGGQGGGGIPTNGLVAYYPFDGNGNDSSGNGNHASVVAASPSTNRHGNANSSYQFDGVDDYIEIPDSDVLSIATTDELTISVWMRPDVLDFPNFQSSGYVHWMGKGVSGQHEWVLRMYNLNSTRPNRTSCYAFNLSGGLGAGSYVQEPVSTGEWIHIVAVYKYPTDEIKLYKNGSLKDQDSFSGYSIIPGNGTAPFRIGTRDFASYFEGAIDDVRIYDRALKKQEITALYNE